MPRRHRTTQPETETFRDLDVSPLIDVSFLLLIFFLVTSVIQKSEADLSTTLPGRPDLASVETLTVEIDAGADGAVRCNGTTVATELSDHRLPALVAELRQVNNLARFSATPIMASIDIDDSASHQRFADLLNALAAAGIENIAIETSP